MVDNKSQGGLHESAADAQATPAEPVPDHDGAGPWHAVGAGALTGQAPRHAPNVPVRRETAMWLVCAGVLGVVATALVFGAREAAVALAVLLLSGSLARAVLPGPGPIGITIRSRGVDVAMFAILGLMIGVLAQTAPNI